ncbi:flagellar hook-basal body complex protein FliE [Kamptonema cortianum]|nr:flagellar hook-basal body complex protein FliE [Geitlerinema splendidum]MDK3158349.1 flagellar hook-basal body complex protein FliE [Kamptonema cortianum]
MRIGQNPISVNPIARPEISTPAVNKGQDFGEMLMDAIKEVNKSQHDVRDMQNDLMANRPVEIHDLMITMERASTSMQLTMQVRNKVLEAYQEIARMQV